jgi:protein-disulfide isomerase
MRILFVSAASILALSACNSGNSGEGNAAASQPVAAVKAPASGDWSTVVTETTAGGFMMGNPEAPVTVVEYGSFTCPHCAEFDETGLQPLIDNYVKSGKVAFEFRNFVRDPLDMAAALIARCNGAQSFFPLSRAIFGDQENWMTKLQQVPPQQLQTLQSLPPEQQLPEIAKLAGFQQFAAARGVPEAKANQCLSNQQTTSQLVQTTSDATSQYPEFPGTPTFILNGKMTEGAKAGQSIWQALEEDIKGALGS